MYIFDTNVFISLGHYYPSRFPSIWDRLDSLADEGSLVSVREVRRELEINCQWEHVLEWMKRYRHIVHIPTNAECRIVSEILQRNQYRDFVKRNNILKGLPVADPFLVAAGKAKGFYVVTQETNKPHAARIPNACADFGVDCINLEGFLEREKMKF